LKDITDDHHGGVQVIRNIEDILGQKFGIPISWSLPVCHEAKGLGGTSAGFAVVVATPAGKDRGHRISIPVDKGLVAHRIDIPHHLLHDVTVINRNIIEVLWDVGKGIDPNSVSSVSVGEVRNILKICLAFDCLKKLEQGLLCGISPHDKIDKGILMEDLLVIIGGREATQNDWSLRMEALDHLGQGQRSLNMSHPMKIDPEDRRFVFLNESLYVEFLVLKHLDGDIDNSYSETMALQIFGEAGEPDRVHFKNRSGGNDIADRAMNPRPLPEVIEGWGMEKD